MNRTEKQGAQTSRVVAGVATTTTGVEVRGEEGWPGQRAERREKRRAGRGSSSRVVVRSRE